MIAAVGSHRVVVPRNNNASYAAKAINAVLIQKSGALDPVDEGFKVFAFGEFQGHVLRNLAMEGFDRWRTTSTDQGYYYRTLTDSEKDFALRNDWTLTCVCAVEQGAAFTAIDFGKNTEPIRFDIVLLNEKGRYLVAVVKKISPAWDFEKIEFAGAGDVGHPHTYQLRYDHKTKRASLWIDNQQKLSGYQGQQQFLEDRGLFLGSFSTGYSKIGTGVFKLVRRGRLNPGRDVILIHADSYPLRQLRTTQLRQRLPVPQMRSAALANLARIPS